MRTFLSFLSGLTLLFTVISCQVNSSGEESDSTGISMDFDIHSDDTTDWNDSGYVVERRKVGLGDSKSAEIEISVPAGVFSVKGGTEDLLRVAAKYKSSQREFHVKQEVTGDVKKVRVSMPTLEGLKEIKDEGSLCSIRLNEKIPIDLEINFGAGKGNFELGSLNLQRLKCGLGAGEFTIQLAGSPLTDLQVDAGVGEATVDLTGPREKDLDAKMNCGIGNLTVNLPAEVGVKVTVSGLLGGIHAGDLKKEAGAYYNESWDKTGPRIRLHINGAIGDVNLNIVRP